MLEAAGLGLVRVFGLGIGVSVFLEWIFLFPTFSRHFIADVLWGVAVSTIVMVAPMAKRMLLGGRLSCVES